SASALACGIRPAGLFATASHSSQWISGRSLTVDSCRCSAVRVTLASPAAESWWSGLALQTEPRCGAKQQREKRQRVIAVRRNLGKNRLEGRLGLRFPFLHVAFTVDGEGEGEVGLTDD